MVHKYTCTCAAGYTGDHCETILGKTERSTVFFLEVVRVAGGGCASGPKIGGEGARQAEGHMIIFGIHHPFLTAVNLSAKVSFFRVLCYTSCSWAPF